MSSEHSKAQRFIIRESDVEPYSPANHSGTVNRRLISHDTVGAKYVEVILGVIGKGHGASLHAHPDVEQGCYVVEGRGLVEVAGVRAEVSPGDCCFFPVGTNHAVTAVGHVPLKLLVIYSPPYGEDPTKVTR